MLLKSADQRICIVLFSFWGCPMSGVMRVLVGIGLFTLGFQLGRAVGRTDPLAEEFKRMRQRRGVVIDGELVDQESVKVQK
mgnify:CR=1 FL=1